MDEDETLDAEAALESLAVLKGELKAIGPALVSNEATMDDLFAQLATGLYVVTDIVEALVEEHRRAQG